MATSPQRNVCAYCNGLGRLTSEHVWPRGILRRTELSVRYTMKAGKTFSGDMTIKDVCRECNNGPLSKLDDYFCQLYDRYFSTTPNPVSPIKFRYDFSLLMKFLLKISYNASRTTGNDADLLSRYAPMLISEFPASPIHAIAFVGTAKAGWLKGPHAGGHIKKIKPLGARCGPVVIPGVDYHEWCALRTVIINGFMFTVQLMRQPTIAHRLATDLRSRIYGVPLLPNGITIIPAPTKSALDFYEGVQNWTRGHR